ncbi:MAG: ATP-binding cassette domain-containing protein, partial [Flammeovirgaceae bacterium]
MFANDLSVRPNIKKPEVLHQSGKVLEVVKLWKSFGNNHVLNGFDLSVTKGESVVVLGKSGSGKSVLIKCIIGLMQPDSGDINVLGKDVPQLSTTELDELRVQVG